jgi:hypothetical protein
VQENGSHKKARLFLNNFRSKFAASSLAGSKARELIESNAVGSDAKFYCELEAALRKQRDDKAAIQRFVDR